MAAGFPTKSNFAAGDVLTSSQMNDLAGTVNLLDPTAKGTIFAASAAHVPAAVTVGSDGQVLTADSASAGGVKWATASSGGMTLLSTTSLSGASTTVSSISTSYKELVIYIKDWAPNNVSDMTLQFNTDTTAANYQQFVARGTGSTNGTFVDNTTSGFWLTGYAAYNADKNNFIYVQIPDYANTNTMKVMNSFCAEFTSTPATAVANTTGAWMNSTPAAITQLVFICKAGSFTQGSVEIYGVK